MTITGRNRERIERIGKIHEMLKLAKSKAREIDADVFIIEIMDRWGVTERTAKDYLKRAFHRLDAGL